MELFYGILFLIFGAVFTVILIANPKWYFDYLTKTNLFLRFPVKYRKILSQIFVLAVTIAFILFGIALLLGKMEV